jgi:glutamate dehydrogenase (NAD(P)+)
MPAQKPALIVQYTDPIEEFQAWLVIDGLNHPLAAGGMRVQQSLTLEHLQKMARNMTKKMRVWGLPINGAKSGIAYDPASPGKDEAVRRFMQAIKPYIVERYSMGGDLNTNMPHLDQIAQSIGIPSIKTAVAGAQGMTLSYFDERYAILEQAVIGNWSLGQLRAGYGVGMAALALLDYLEIEPQKATAAVQGFGTLAKASMVGLLEANVQIKAIADAEKCIRFDDLQAFDFDALLAHEGTLLPEFQSGDGISVLPRDEIFSSDTDVLMLEAIENAITADNAANVRARGVVPGANLAVTTEAEAILYGRGVPVLPCFVAGSGGTVAMNGLFGPTEHPTPREVLEYVKTAMAAKVRELLVESALADLTPTQVAERLVEDEPPVNRSIPYAIS